jgi:endonuclease YncB( thermonuclease family)
MPFTLIKGSFRVVGASPDGDSIRFFADDPSLVHALPGPFDPKPKPFAQLRLEGIDTLETHYAGRRQPTKWAQAATKRLLDFVGIADVVWDANHNTIITANDGTRGWIASREREKNRRPVAFLFAGETSQNDGQPIALTPQLLKDSYNYTACAEGLAYPTYYQGLFGDLRDVLTNAVIAARNANLGLWPEDGTNKGFNATTLGVLIDEVPILPKLFRRLSDFMAAQATAVGFRDALAQSMEGVLDLSNQNFTHFDTFIAQAVGSTHVRMTVPPEQLVFDPMPDKPTNKFASMVGAPISGDWLGSYQNELA